MSTSDNHRSWAKYYDEVNRRCFGEYYDQLTKQTLQQIGTLGKKLHIADFGAGTGRLTIPLSELGHEGTKQGVRPLLNLPDTKTTLNPRVWYQPSGVTA
jgi:ubiquinone/menaquinone biosynthesis C-methylase UbiE